MQDISTTLRGRIGSEPAMKHVKGDICVTTFRLAITRWRFASDGRTGNASYVEDGAYWYTVETWDTLASNVFRSCRKGDPVIVVARPVPNGWIDANGQIRSSIVYRASSVGHDLARGTSQFTKNGTHSIDQAAGGTQDDPYSTRRAADHTPQEAVAGAPFHPAGGEDEQLECVKDTSEERVGQASGRAGGCANEEETAAAPAREETGGPDASLPTARGEQMRQGSEEDSSDPVTHGASRFDYSAVGHPPALRTCDSITNGRDDDTEEPIDAP